MYEQVLVLSNRLIRLVFWKAEGPIIGLSSLFAIIFILMFFALDPAPAAANCGISVSVRPSHSSNWSPPSTIVRFVVKIVFLALHPLPHPVPPAQFVMLD